MFSDAVFAINITLIGLELRPPPVPAGRLMSGLLHEWPVYLAYLTSFLSLAIAWLNHRAVFARITRISLGLTWANIGVLLTIGLVPFPTRVVAEALAKGDDPDIRAAVALYGLIGVAISLAFLMLNSYLWRHPGLVDESVEQAYFRRARYRSLVGLLGWSAAGLLGYFTIPWIGLGILVAVPAFYAIASGGPTFEAHPMYARRSS
jgi:uncharacterized membrane protein